MHRAGAVVRLGCRPVADEGFSEDRRRRDARRTGEGSGHVHRRGPGEAARPSAGGGPEGPGVSGAALTGSYASGRTDRWSDLDLVLAVRGDPATVRDDWTERLYSAHGALHHWDLAGPEPTLVAGLPAARNPRTRPELRPRGGVRPPGPAVARAVRRTRRDGGTAYRPGG
ncbi:nucleotidyltransferase domain-containing protein [Streptomyces sp. NPDC049954]|uniref:nucleotidyltransferase domain-containing protein n=1 Tax=Streptomyces sp. NPDC049954 TaxID=3155779 RepID=UPI003430C1C5